jgi:hypothetical protein
MQDNNKSHELGPLVATYGTSRSFLGVGRLLAALFVVAGAFVLWLATRTGHEGLQFGGDPKLLQGVGFGLVAVGVAVERIFGTMARRHVTIHVHEHGVRAIGRERDQVDFHVDIEDIYLVSTGLFGWRASPTKPWVIVDNRVSKMAELRQHLLGLQLAQRGERLWNQLQAGGSVTFHMIPEAAVRRQIWVDARDVDHPVSDITLTPRELTIAGKTIALARLRKLDRGVQRERVKFIDVDGNAFYETQSNAILSIALLLALIEELQPPV